ncbi:MAG TPA: hypothetical protein VG797_03350 [Phycisphaerales bacterium]|nr:hypothetical protein [Phycisphaerales bacterium]
MRPRNLMNEMVVVAAATLAAMSSTQARGANTAAVLGGSDADAGLQGRINTISGVAQQQFVDRGYAVTRLDNVSRAAFLNSLCQGSVTHLTFTGHGATGRGFLGRGRVWLGGGHAPENYISSDDIIASVPLECRQRIRFVNMNACGQLRSGWADAFPNARVHSYTGSVRADTAEENQREHGAEAITPKGGRGDETPGFSGLTVDSRIDLAIPLVYHPSVDEFFAEDWGDFTAMPWRIPDALAASVGSRRFNFIVMDTPEDQVMIAGIEIDVDRAVAQSYTGYASPDFVVRFSHAAYEAAIENIDTIPGAFGTSAAGIDADTTGVPPHLLFQAAVAVTFGLGAEPPCEGDADLSGGVGLSDIAVILTHWGVSGAPGRVGDLDGSGVRGLGDVARVIAHWGAGCE